jgi:phospholipase/carboxylesterase
MSTLDRFPHRIRPSRGEPEGVLVLLHGRGTDENDLYPLLDLLDPERRLVGVTPRGPLSLPPGGAHWYVIREVGHPDRDSFLASYEALSGWLDALPGELSAEGGRCVLGGFSQGAVMSYALALGRDRPRPDALVALSGFIPSAEGFEIDLSDSSRPKVAIGHGTFDPVIDVEFSRQARQVLEQAGFEVLYREAPLAHTVDAGFLAEVSRWIGG